MNGRVWGKVGREMGDGLLMLPRLLRLRHFSAGRFGRR